MGQEWLHNIQNGIWLKKTCSVCSALLVRGNVKGRRVDPVHFLGWNMIFWVLWVFSAHRDDSISSPKFMDFEKSPFKGRWFFGSCASMRCLLNPYYLSYAQFSINISKFPYDLWWECPAKWNSSDNFSGLEQSCTTIQLMWPGSLWIRWKEGEHSEADLCSFKCDGIMSGDWIIWCWL